MEEWKDIAGYADRYAVSSHGRIKSKPFVKRGRGRSGPFSFTTKELILSPGNVLGYRNVVLTKDGKRSTKLVHRLVAEAFIPNPKFLPTVNHKDSVRCNNNALNLEWMTVQENVAHSYNSGNNSNAAEFNSGAILNWEIVREIRRKYTDGLKVSEIARHFDLKYATVSKVVLFKNWKEEP